MLRLLILLLLAWLVYRGIASLTGRLSGAPGSGTFRPEPPAPPRPSQVIVTVHREGGEELVPCARCGVRVPKSRTVAGEGGAVVCRSCSGEQRT